MAEIGMTLICERLAGLEASDKYHTKKIDEIHKALIGNGQPGLIAEWNQWKGGVKFFGIIMGCFVTLLSICVGVLACII